MNTCIKLAYRFLSRQQIRRGEAGLTFIAVCLVAAVLISHKAPTENVKMKVKFCAFPNNEQANYPDSCDAEEV